MDDGEELARMVDKARKIGHWSALWLALDGGIDGRVQQVSCVV